MKYEFLRLLEDAGNSSPTGPIRAHIAPGARRAFGYRGHDAPIASGDPRVVTPPRVASMPTDYEGKERLALARTCHSAEQYANTLAVPVERGDPDHVLRQHAEELDRYRAEWDLWKRSGMLG